MRKKLPTIRELTLQLQAQGEVILQLREDAALRDKLAIRNKVAAIMSEESRADLPEVAREKDYGYAVRSPTQLELLQMEVETLKREFVASQRDRPEPGEEPTRAVRYCWNCGEEL